jgi:hypothetical protein
MTCAFLFRIIRFYVRIVIRSSALHTKTAAILGNFANPVHFYVASIMFWVINLDICAANDKKVCFGKIETRYMDLVPQYTALVLHDPPQLLRQQANCTSNTNTV